MRFLGVLAIKYLGIFLLCFGIMMLFASGTIVVGWIEYFASGKTDTTAIAMQIAVALFPFASIVGGIALIRVAEDGRSRRKAEDPSEADASGQQTVPSGDLVKRIRAKVGAFDLNRLNWTGWLLLFATFGFGMIQVALVEWGADEIGFQVKNPPQRGVWLPVGLLAIGFYFGVRWLLNRFGISIYRW
jgi:hypothetical protein